MGERTFPISESEWKIIQYAVLQAIGVASVNATKVAEHLSYVSNMLDQIKTRNNSKGGEDG